MNTTIRTFLIAVGILLSTHTQAQPKLGLELFTYQEYFGSEDIIALTNCGDDRLFIVQREGYIKILHPDGSVNTFLDIHDKTKPITYDIGLLALAFDPNYAVNGYFYVFYTNKTGYGNIVLARYSRNAVNPDLAVKGSEVILMNIETLGYSNNGGALGFGPDGYLYIGIGNSGSGDPINFSQDINSLYGKILRLDVSTVPYSIPPTNPFVGVSGADEIWQIGFRNPRYLSFDYLTNDLWISELKELNVAPGASTGGENFGYNCYDGFTEIAAEDCIGVDLEVPLLAYFGAYSSVFTSGYVYRSGEYPGLYGQFITFKDIAGDESFIMIGDDGAGGWNIQEIDDTEVWDPFADIQAFGEGADGTVYAIADYYSIYKVIDMCVGYDATTIVTDADYGFSNGAIDLSIISGSSPYNYSWSNGATTEDISDLSEGDYTVTITDANGCVKTTTATVAGTCGELPSITTIATTSTTASFDWTDMGVATYKVQYRPSAGGAWINTIVSESTIALTGLTPATSYKMKVSYTCPSGLKFSRTKNFATPARLDEEDQVIPQLAPNPSTGIVYINNLTADTQIYIVDLSGKHITAPIDYASGVLDMTAMPQGFYQIQFVVKGAVIANEKILITR